MSTPQPQPQIQVQDQNESLKKEVKKKSREELLKYIHNNVTALTLKSLINDIINPEDPEESPDPEVVINRVAKLIMLANHGEEITKSIVVNLYEDVTENNLYNYNIEEIKVGKLQIHDRFVDALTRLPNDVTVTDVTIWYNENKLLYKEFYKELVETKALLREIVDTLMKLKNANKNQKEREETKEEEEEE